MRGFSGKLSRRAGVALVAFCVLLSATVLFHAAWLGWLGSLLVEDQPPFHADIIDVLGGDLRGNRILTAAALARDGYAPLVLVSGSGAIYGRHESDLAVAFAVANGFDEKLFLKLKFPADSTRDEARAVTQEMRRLHVTRFLLVTSNFHTRRAAAIFQDEARGLPFRVIGCPDSYFTPGGWWKNREGQKTFAFEWSKTMANWFGI